MARFALAALWLAALASAPAFASVDSIPFRNLSFAPLPAAPGDAPAASRALQPEQAFLRGQAVLQYFGVPAEGAQPSFVAELAGKQSPDGLRSTLAIMDPSGEFGSMLKVQEGQAQVFQDPGALENLDFSVALAGGAPDDSAWAGTFHERILRARENSPGQQLAGLRIAIDPGHMGGDVWDGRTGKFVRDSQGNQVSEGVINLQVALLLEQRLTALGAEVLLTRRGLEPVTDVTWDGIDIQAYGLRELRENTLKPWFQSLLSVAEAGPDLFRAFSDSQQLKSLFAVNDFNRATYFILREDLFARARKIEAFQPDIALVIHFDADVNHPNPVHHDATKAYVVGTFAPDEVSSREDRWYFARHLLDARAWDASYRLGRSVISHFHAELDLPFDQGGGGGNSRELEPGLFARNLAVSRLLGNAAVSYVECLYYNDPTEFAELLRRDHPLDIGGVNMPYSDRIAAVAQSLGDAVTQFVADYGQ